MKQSIYIFLIFIFAAIATEGVEDATEVRPSEKPEISYGAKGFQIVSKSKKNLLHLEFRAQFRLSVPYEDDPRSLDAYEAEEVYFAVNRARVKVGGHAFQPWLKYYLEYDFPGSNLLDFRVMIEKYPFLKLKVGQWKVQYNRERVISSGKQQTAERSILTRTFTLDRQQGISLFGRLKGDGVADFKYWLSVFMGTGRGGDFNDDKELMYMARLQWNFLGRELGFKGSDLARHPKWTTLLAVAATTNQSQFTRFSTSGGGQLDEFTESNPSQYRIYQTLVETAGKYQGFSWQQEFHWKDVHDQHNAHRIQYVGNLFQTGVFLNTIFQKAPKQLELFARHAFVIPDMVRSDLVQQEITFGLNSFFKQGHRNKLTLEASYLTHEYDFVADHGVFRYRLQWDISL